MRIAKPIMIGVIVPLYEEAKNNTPHILGAFIVPVKEVTDIADIEYFFTNLRKAWLEPTADTLSGLASSDKIKFMIDLMASCMEESCIEALGVMEVQSMVRDLFSDPTRH